jgi:hypothetical protein
MKPSRFYTYLFFIFVVAGGAIGYIVNDYYTQQAEAKTNNTTVVMYKNPGCQCCDRWAEYMEENEFTVTVNESQNLPSIKKEHSVPQGMEASHTAFVGGYVVEGHVPANDVKRLLKEQPKVPGLVVPGMPASSPGMNTAINEPYDVYLFDRLGRVKIFGSH